MRTSNCCHDVCEFSVIVAWGWLDQLIEPQREEILDNRVAWHVDAFTKRGNGMPVDEKWLTAK
jgi:hypothetical protein